MGAMQSRAKSCFAKLSFVLGEGVADFRKGGDFLHKQYGVRDPLALSDTQARQFADSVRNMYGSFRARGTSPSDNDLQPLMPSRDGSRKAKLDPAAIYARFNKQKAGVAIKKQADDE